MLSTLLRNAPRLGRPLVLRPALAARLIVGRVTGAQIQIQAGSQHLARMFATAVAADKPAKARKVKSAAASGSKKKAGVKAKTKTGVKKKSASADKKKKLRRVGLTKKKVGVRKVKVRGKPLKKTLKKILKKDLAPPFKTPGNSWMNFVKEFSVGKEGQALVGEAHREAAQVWRTMSDEEKQKYAPAPEAVAQFKQNRKEWFATLDARHRTAYRKAHKKPGLKGLPNVYAVFTKENYHKVPAGTFMEKNRLLRELWETVSEEEKNRMKRDIAEQRQGVLKAREQTATA